MTEKWKPRKELLKNCWDKVQETLYKVGDLHALQEDLNILKGWVKRWKMSFKVDTFPNPNILPSYTALCTINPYLWCNRLLTLVVGDINTSLGLTGMHLELASDERVQEMVDFLMEHFYPDETICKSVGLVMNEHWKKLMLERYIDNLSLLLVSDVTNQVIGVKTITVTPACGQTIDLSSIEDAGLRTVLTFLRHKYSDMNVYKYFGVDCAVSFNNLGVHKDYRNKGLGSTLMKVAMLYVKDIGLETVCISGEGTSNYSQKIFEKFGFEVIHTVKYEDYKVEGEVVFKNTGNNETCKFYVKRIKK